MIRTCRLVGIGHSGVHEGVVGVARREERGRRVETFLEGEDRRIAPALTLRRVVTVNRFGYPGRHRALEEAAVPVMEENT